MLDRVTSLLFVACAIACSDPKPRPSRPEPATRAVPAPIIAVQALTVRFEGTPIARVHADGRTESVGNSAPGPDATFTPGPTLHADGTIELTKGGFKVRVDTDGDVFLVSPPAAGQPDRLAWRLAGDRVVSANDPDTGVRLEGATLVMFADDKPTGRIGDVDPPSAGRTALILSAAFYLDASITAR